VLTFWNTLLLQASLNEPAVLHAVLTLSSVHKREILVGRVQGGSDDESVPFEQEQFMLSQYVKAIGHLQPHFETKEKGSVRVALITCVVFICLEFLRGHFRTGQKHLENGLRVLREMYGESGDDEGVLRLKPSNDPIDDWIAEAFSRLQIQELLFTQSWQDQVLLLQDPEPPLTIFNSLPQAWQQVERRLQQIFHMGQQSHRQRISYDALLAEQQHIQACFAQWLSTIETSRENLLAQDPVGFACEMLSLYHSMACIMVSTCLSSSPTSFDTPNNTAQFLSILSLAAHIWDFRRAESRVMALPGNRISMSRSVVDMGWIPPLYYTVLRCRIHRVRLHAVRLLEASSHREGISDAKVAACVVRKVMELEEKDLNIGKGEDEFDLFKAPGVEELDWDLVERDLKGVRRICDLKVILPDGPEESVFLSCRQRGDGEEWEDVELEYRVLEQCWVDVRTSATS
jgi:hypothetical protein